MDHPGRIETAHLYAPLHEQLILLLESLTPAQWLEPTVCRGWAVRDIAAHLLDVDVRRLSSSRDHFEMPSPDKPISGYDDLVGFINRLNADWITAARRLSPRILVDLLRLTGTQVAEHLKVIDMEAPARFSVAWAGEAVSLNWFAVARDYTERWHHQQQIRDAVGATPSLTSAYWLSPVLDTFMRALPHHYRDVVANEGDAVGVTIEGDAGGDWTLLRTGGSWRLLRGRMNGAAVYVTLTQDTAWRRFTKGITSEEARRRARIYGDVSLGEPFVSCLAIMA